MSFSLTTFDKAITAGVLQAGGIYAALKGSGASLDPMTEILLSAGAGIVAGFLVFIKSNKA